MEDLDKEWENLSDTAVGRLEGALDQNEQGVQSLIQVLVRPAFEPDFVWRLLRHNPPFGKGNVSYSARCLCWRKDVDNQKFRSPEERLRYSSPLHPTFETHDILLDAAYAENALTHLCALTIPAFVPQHIMGFDGVTYRLRVGDLFLRAEYQWWCDPPESWKPLSNFVDQLVDDLTRLKAAVVGIDMQPG